MKDLLIVGLGGFFGSIARYGVSLLNSSFYPDKYYQSTLIVNLAGSLILGIIAGALIRSNNQTVLFLTVGFCGGFTTFSTFALDAVKLLKSGMYYAFTTYLALSVFGGLLLCVLGFWLSHKPQ
ncbi:MAG: fluoride efflux transporter CrcB [Ekhidna sp.]